MMKFSYSITLFLLFSLSACEVAQKQAEDRKGKEKITKADKFTPEIFQESDVPEEISQLKDVKIAGGAKWKDTKGDFLLVLVEFPVIQKTNPEASKGSIDSVNHAEVQIFLFKDKKQIQRFPIVESAPLDVAAKFIREATTLSDADNDNVGEAYLLVKHHTRGDVSPSSLTLITFTNESKFIMSGTMRVVDKKDKKNNMGGEKDEKGFRNAPDAIKKQADKIWEKFVEEDFDTHFKS